MITKPKKDQSNYLLRGSHTKYHVSSKYKYTYYVYAFDLFFIEFNVSSLTLMRRFY